MNIIIKVSLLLSFCFSIIQPQSKYDFKSDSMFVVYGKNNYTGIEDCNAKVYCNSDGKNIHIKVHVNDNILMLNDDPLNSDHIELWFSLPYLPDNYAEFMRLVSNKFIISDSSLFLMDGIPDLQGFKSYLQNPLIRAYDAGIDSFYYNQIDDSLGNYYDWLKGSVNDYLRVARSSKLYVNHFPFGVVHFGLLPKHNITVQYDKELYAPLERFTNIKLEDLSKYINFSSTIEENGYSLDIKVGVESLGFVSKYGVGNLRFLVDVVDVDARGKQETLLSTSKNRIWGEPSTFNELSFHNHIDVEINKNIKPLGQENSNKNVYDRLIDRISNYFVKTKDGWIPVDINEVMFNEYNQPETYLMEDISEFKFHQGTLTYKQEYDGNNLLEYINCSYKNYIILNKKQLLPESGIIKSIRLPDGKRAFLYSDFEVTGRYTRQLSSYLYLVTDTSKQLIASYLFGYPPSISLDCFNTYVEKKWDYNKLEWIEGEYENIRWENVIDYKDNDRFMALNLSDSLRYKISWDDKGNILK